MDGYDNLSMSPLEQRAGEQSARWTLQAWYRKPSNAALAVIPTSVLGASEPETGSKDKPFCLRFPQDSSFPPNLSGQTAPPNQVNRTRHNYGTLNALPAELFAAVQYTQLDRKMEREKDLPWRNDDLFKFTGQLENRKRALSSADIYFPLRHPPLPSRLPAPV
ncbi:hypothetical protein RRG08_032373 [Elysia crispata]|uniref:Uncharacterized protein n=1 Tax=Elysia crispata TaxID=231223 RepID=A0AAE1AGW2_9GAST|nr:hypothetical protein RRG08_032373 [Elysia crispata]